MGKKPGFYRDLAPHKKPQKKPPNGQKMPPNGQQKKEKTGFR
jgi:hypothetical protein